MGRGPRPCGNARGGGARAQGARGHRRVTARGGQPPEVAPGEAIPITPPPRPPSHAPFARRAPHAAAPPRCKRGRASERDHAGREGARVQAQLSRRRAVDERATRRLPPLPRPARSTTSLWETTAGRRRWWRRPSSKRSCSRRGRAARSASARASSATRRRWRRCDCSTSGKRCGRTNGRWRRRWRWTPRRRAMWRTRSCEWR